MDITFLIGNGFDLSLGMKTRFIDMYSEYVEMPSKSETIKKFKENLMRDKSMHYENWSDFEMGMAKYAEQLKSEDELIECVRDFKLFMVDFLVKENNTTFAETLGNPEVSKEYVREFEKSIDEFFLGLSANDTQTLNNMTRSALGNGFNFITFNYTSILDSLVNRLNTDGRRIHNILDTVHIHGLLGQDVVLGIDNVQQISWVGPQLTRKGQRAFIKPYFNQVYDKARVEKAINIIESSTIICVYGLSLGESDRTWREEIKKWLKSSPSHHLIYYVYDKKHYDMCNFDEKLDIEEERKLELINRLGFGSDETDVLFEQVHIPVGSDIFNFENIVHIEAKGTTIENPFIVR